MDRAVANRYVSALAEVITQDGSQLSPEAVLDQLESFGELLAESADLSAILRAPSVSPRDKRALIVEIGARLGLAEPIVNFLSVVADERRTRDYRLIVEGFRLWLDTHHNRVEVRVRSASGLSDDQRSELESRFRQLTGSDLRVSYAEDPGLLGGSAVQVGSTLYDGSLRAALGSLRSNLKSGSARR